MEPVPETERMEEFRSSPLPTLRLQGGPASSVTFASPTPLSPRSIKEHELFFRKPSSMRRSTEPSSPCSPSWPLPPAAVLSYRPRTASPLSGSHVRSRSTASLLSPSMARTQSMPGVNGAGHLQLRTEPRLDTLGHHRPLAVITRTPKKSLVEDVFPSSPTRMSVRLDSDRQLHERNSSPNLSICPPSPSTATAITSLPLARTRRPSSPYRLVSTSNIPAPPSLGPTISTQAISTPVATSNSPDSGLAASTPIAVPSSSVLSCSPLHRPSDTLPSATSYGSLGGLSTSSIPSTPTSTRSRSPSISSLETIPDSPDAEEAALEADRIAQLKAAADAAESGDVKGRSSLDVPTRGRTLAFGSRDKRKRWSVCGAERRGDLDLETIWED